jgi:CRISPR/Cas system CSM-associated protein Csm4 (group 5 of RAMP superfamily)
VDPVYHSDSLYSAVTGALRTLGHMDAWLDGTARNPKGSAVRFSSCFPFHEDIGYIIPPRSIWPPMSGAPVTSPKVRWKSARYVPLGLVDALLSGQVLDEEHWSIDGPSECLVPAGRPGPFRMAIRSAAAVDRLTGAVERHATACIEFVKDAGLWTVVSFAGADEYEQWNGPVRAAFRLLADSGFGGERGRGWGRSEAPEFIEGALPDMILPPRAKPEPVPQPEGPQSETVEAVASPVEAAGASAEIPEPEPAPQSRDREGAVSTPAQLQHWLLSLFAPASEDAIDWTKGSYSVLARSGRVESPIRQGELKKQLNMIAEGSVLIAATAPQGSSPDVAPDGFPHPVYRAGFALTIPLPPQVTP